MKQIIAVVVLAGCISGCSKPETASFSTVEEQRRTVRDNVTLLANKYRAENKLEGTDLYIRGDSTVSGECPQGDGWASVDLVRSSDHGLIQKLKCSTVSEGIGCMTADDFKTKRYAQEEDHCSTAVPFPIPKIAH